MLISRNFNQKPSDNSFLNHFLLNKFLISAKRWCSILIKTNPDPPLSCHNLFSAIILWDSNYPVSGFGVRTAAVFFRRAWTKLYINIFFVSHLHVMGSERQRSPSAAGGRLFVLYANQTESVLLCPSVSSDEKLKVITSSFMAAGESSNEHNSHHRLSPDSCPSLTRLHYHLWMTRSHRWIENWNFCRTVVRIQVWRLWCNSFCGPVPTETCTFALLVILLVKLDIVVMEEMIALRWVQVSSALFSGSVSFTENIHCVSVLVQWDANNIASLLLFPPVLFFFYFISMKTFSFHVMCLWVEQ